MHAHIRMRRVLCQPLSPIAGDVEVTSPILYQNIGEAWPASRLLFSYSPPTDVVHCDVLDRFSSISFLSLPSLLCEH